MTISMARVAGAAAPADAPIPQPLPSHDGQGSAPAPTAPSAALPWDGANQSFQQTVQVTRRHGLSGGLTGGVVGAIIGGMTGVIAFEAHSGSMSIGVGAAIGAAIAGAGYAIGHWGVTSTSSDVNPDYDAAAAQKAAVAALPGHAFAASRDLDYSSDHQQGQTGPDADHFVVDRVISTTSNRNAAAGTLYDKSEALTVLADGGHARGMIEVQAPGSDAPTWVVVDMHADLAAVPSIATRPDGQTTDWTAPRTDALLVRVDGDATQQDVVRGHDRYHETSSRPEAVVLNGGQINGDRRTVLAAGASKVTSSTYAGPAD